MSDIHSELKYVSTVRGPVRGRDNTSIVIDNNNISNTQQDKCSTHNPNVRESCSTHNPKKLRGMYPFYPAPHVPAAYLKWAAYQVYRRSRRGLTFNDLLRGRYRCASTKERAQNLLHLHKSSENLYVKSKFTRSRPQEYFSTKDDAEQADIQDKKKKLLEQSSTHIQVSGSRTCATTTPEQLERLQWERDEQEQDKGMLTEIAYIRQREERLATDLMTILQMAALKRRVGLFWGMHDVRIDFHLPPEVYSDDQELQRIAPIQPTQQKPRKLSIKVDRFIVTILVYHNGRTVATIGTRDQPLPVTDVPGHVSTSLTALAGEMRSRLCSILTGSGGNRIVPPVHEWRLMHLDLNSDVRVTANTYADLAVNSAQLHIADKVILGVYRTMTDKLDPDHHSYVRVEDRKHQFKSDGSRNGTPLDATVGQVVTSAVENFRQQLEGASTGA